MANADAAVLEKGTVRLQVAAARQEESGRGVARMPRSAFQALGITEGDAIEVEGKRVTAAIAFQAYDEDEALEVVRLDGLLRANADTSSGEHVTIRRAESRPAARVVFAPAQREMRLQAAELNDYFLLLCYMEVVGLPNPAALYLLEVYPHLLEQFHLWHRRMGMDRSPVGSLPCC